MSQKQMLSSKEFKIPAIVFFVVVGLAWWGGRSVVGSESGYWYSIVPAALAVCLSMATHRLFLSLLSAIIGGGILIGIYKEVGFTNTLARAGTEIVRIPFGAFANWDNLQIVGFAVFILTTITIIARSGGLHAIIEWLSQYAKTRRSSLLITAVMGVLIFIDDYANTMIVGPAMRPITDRKRISREKLSFLVDATAAPVAGVAFISTWIGYEVGLFEKEAAALGFGGQTDGYSMFFDALGFRFYCILMIIFVFLNVIWDRDFGPMRKAERRAIEKGQVSAPSAVALTSQGFSTVEPDPSLKPRALTAVIPFVVIFAGLFYGLYRTGGGAEKIVGSSILSFTAWRSVIADANSIVVLFYSSIAGLVTSMLCGLIISKASVSTIVATLLRGLKSGLLPAAILVLAWSIKDVCNGLDTAKFLLAATGDVLSPIWFPAVVFVLAALVAFATGTSWGTMAILIPAVIPIAFQLDGGTYSLVTMICLGAVLDGAILGDHCSPISDTTVMSSIASSCDHIDHVKTQLPYSVLVGALALLCGYLPAALGMPSVLSITIAFGVMMALFAWLPKYELSRFPETAEALKATDSKTNLETVV